MATTLDIIKSSLEMLGVIAAGETPATPDSDRALSLLNNLIDAWKTDGLMIFSVERTTHTLTSSLNPHTIGSGGTFNTTRPVTIERAGLIPSGSTVEKELEVIDFNKYAEISDKTQEGEPRQIYYDPAYTSARGNINLWPEPNAAHTLVLYKRAALHTTLPLATGTTISVPPGYQRMMEFNLAVEIAPYFGAEASPTIQAVALQSKSDITLLNSRTPELVCDSGVVGSPQVDILSLQTK